MSIIEVDPWLITDKYNEEAKHMNPGFKDNRHDQSIQSVAKKLLECVTLSAAEHHLKAEADKPFRSSRIRE